MEFVQARHEELSAFMACAHAKFTHRHPPPAGAGLSRARRRVPGVQAIWDPQGKMNPGKIVRETSGTFVP